MDAIGVVVSDLQRAVDLYSRLGLEFPDPPDPEGHGHVEANLPAGIRLMFDTEESVKSFDPDWSPPSGQPRIGIAFLCDSPDEVDRVYAELTGGGASGTREPWDAPWRQRYASLADPDGNAIDLFAPL
jgi:catechol 2,3-dioxygenase-like lactoylglutathione lyase family enzyme